LRVRVRSMKLSIARSAALAELVTAVTQSVAAYVALAALAALGRQLPPWVAALAWSQAVLVLLVAIALWHQPHPSRFIWMTAAALAAISVVDVLWSARRLIAVQWPPGLLPRLMVSVVGLKLLSQLVVLGLALLAARDRRVAAIIGAGGGLRHVADD
jgi:hypothetical protein